MTVEQVRPSSGRPYVHTCWSYVHKPHDPDRHAITEALLTLIFTSGRLADSADFELIKSKVPQNWADR